jgi:hypothetical protein
VGAERVASFWKIPPKQAFALCKQKILRFWGLTALRGWDRLILGCFQGLVLSPGDPTAATRKLDFNLHSQRNFFFPDTRRSLLTLQASAGGVEAVSKRQFMLSGSPCCVSTSFLLREKKT